MVKGFDGFEKYLDLKTWIPFLFTFSLHLSIGTLILSLLTFVILSRMTRTARLVNKFPGSTILPFIGNLRPTAPHRIQERLTRARRKYGRTYRVWLLHRPALFTSDLCLIQKILSSPTHVEKGEMYKNATFGMGNGLVTSDPETWRHDRKFLAPAFKVIPNFLTTFNKHSRWLIQTLGEKLEGGNEVIDLHPILGRSAFSIVCDSMFGVTVEAEDGYYEAACSLIELLVKRMYKPWLKVPLVWELLGYGRMERDGMNHLQQLFPLHVMTRKKTDLTKLENTEEVGGLKGSSQSLLDLLLMNKSPVDTFYHVTSILGAGFETTSGVMNQTMFLLACHPEIQEKVHEELDGILVGMDLEVDDIGLEDVKGMRYLEMCLKESMRIYPPAPYLMRKVGLDIQMESGLIVPKGSDVLILPWDVHHDPEVYPDPNRFDPQRFSPELCGQRSPFSYLPFSAGPRNCVGQKYGMIEMKVILSHILAAYEVRVNEEGQVGLGLEFNYGIVLHPRHPLKLQFLKRKSGIISPIISF